MLSLLTRRDYNEFSARKDLGLTELPDIDLRVRWSTIERYSAERDDFTSVRGETCTVRAFERGRWSACSEARTRLTCDRENFQLIAELDAWEGQRRVFCESWDETIPRDHL